MIVIGILILFLFILGIIEKRKNETNLKKIPIRINVNGTRGKSTVTRLIVAMLKESSENVIGKTTGTEARFIYKNFEREIKRKPEGPNIKEQIKVVKEARDLGASALVCECMAINPDYQKVYSHEILKANICVIVNVLEDHLDVIGPTTDEAAKAFAQTIPYNGKLIITNDKYTNYFIKIAKKRHTKVYVADNDEIPKGYLNKFKYIVFPENVSVVLAVAKCLGIKKEVALEGMLKANPDPGTLKIKDIDSNNSHFTFVNAFAANDSYSTYKILDKINDLGYDTNDMVVLYNGRADRTDRTKKFAENFFEKIQIPYTLATMGQECGQIKNNYKKGNYKTAKTYIDLENQSPKNILKKLEPYVNGKVLFAVGNIHGDGDAFLNEIEMIDSSNRLNEKNEEKRKGYLYKIKELNNIRISQKAQ